LLPSISISSPYWGEKFPLNTPINIWVEAAKHPAGFAIRQVTVVVDDVPAIASPIDYIFSTPPFTEDAAVEIVAYAEDWAGNIVTSDSVKIGVGDVTVPPNPADEPPPPEPSPQALPDAYCTVAADAARPDWLVVLLLLALFARSPRRSTRN
jgi:MYXO-CTERM domain-containing protein